MFTATANDPGDGHNGDGDDNGGGGDNGGSGSTTEPDHFQFAVQPHDVGVNEWFTVEVAILDASGNVVPLNGTQIYLGLWPEGSDVPDNTRLAGDRFVDTNNGVAVFNLYITEPGRYRFMARSDYLPKNLGPFGPELFSNTFEVH
jgi:hypothetical protein